MTTTRLVLDDLMDSKEAAAYLRTTEGTLRQQRLRGSGPKFVKLGRRVLYRAVDLAAYVDANVQQGETA